MPPRQTRFTLESCSLHRSQISREFEITVTLYLESTSSRASSRQVVLESSISTSLSRIYCMACFAIRTLMS